MYGVDAFVARLNSPINNPLQATGVSGITSVFQPSDLPVSLADQGEGPALKSPKNNVPENFFQSL